jgi:hypothetical protein
VTTWHIKGIERHDWLTLTLLYCYSRMSPDGMRNTMKISDGITVLRGQFSIRDLLNTKEETWPLNSDVQFLVLLH